MNTEKPWNKSKKTWPLTFLCIGFILGALPGTIEIQRLRSDLQVTIQQTSQELTSLRRQVHAEGMYYQSQIAAYRGMLNIREVSPTETEKGMGLFCRQEFGTPGQVGFGSRSWRPRADGRCYVEDVR